MKPGPFKLSYVNVKVKTCIQIKSCFTFNKQLFKGGD